MAHVKLDHVLSLACGLSTLRPVFAVRMHEQVGIATEADGRDRHLRLLALPVARLGVLVPDDPMAVASRRSERVVLLVEADGVDGPDLAIFTCLLFSVTLEAEVILVDCSGILEVDLDDADAALDAANSVALARAEALDRACGVTQGTLGEMNGVELVLLDELQVPHVNLLVAVARDKQWVLAAHLVHGFADVRLADLANHVALYLPELDHAVPAAGHQEARAVQVERVDVFDGLLVLADIDGRLRRVVRVPHLDVVVGVRDEQQSGARSDRFGRLLLERAQCGLRRLIWNDLLPADAQDRALNLRLRHRHHLGRRVFWLR